MTLYKHKMTNSHTAKHNLINNIIRLNEIAVKRFDIELLKKEELYDINFNDLKNIETELRIQIGIKRHVDFNHAI